jgi:hypothetical protein
LKNFFDTHPKTAKIVDTIFVAVFTFFMGVKIFLDQLCGEPTPEVRRLELEKHRELYEKQFPKKEGV